MEKVLQVDMEKCVGCHTCEVACSLKHTGRVHPARSRIKVISYEKRGEYHNYIPMVCQQCSTPLCMEACPTNAISKNEYGAMVVDDQACVGCRVCSMICPIGGVSIDPVTNVAFKCDLCDGDPECVKYCDVEAITYVPLDKLDVSMKRAKAEKLSELFTLMQSLR
ncbi:MAG: 4Fe-4S dicluster domain-containing protein [Candidatus Bathyarchaeota archaeon]|nr:4Fe-4S dicluster domain-containing protein [Candidatus Bathyarchaeota archaeon]